MDDPCSRVGLEPNMSRVGDKVPVELDHSEAPWDKLEELRYSKPTIEDDKILINLDDTNLNEIDWDSVLSTTVLGKRPH